MIDNFTSPPSHHQYAVSYARRGWQVLKLHPNSKAPDTPNGVHSATTDTRIIEGWFADNHNGMAVACGAKSGIVVVDIDPRNGGDEAWKALCEKHSYQPDTLTAKTGGGGWHMVFQYPLQGARSCIIGPGIDVISDGKYIVVEPNRLGNGYGWLDWDVVSDPAGAHISALPEWMVETIRPERPQIINGVMRQGRPVAVFEIDEVTRKDLQSALEFIDPDDYHRWIRMGLALRCLGDVGRSLWMNYSVRSEKFDQRQAESKWASFAPAEISFETVFWEAKQLGWCSVPVVPAEQVRPVERAVRAVLEYTEELMTVPGVLGRVVDWYNLTSPMNQPLFAVQTALAFGSVVCARRFKTSNDNYASLYFLNVAESGTGKEHCKSGLEKLLDACGMGPHIGPSRFSSDTAVHDSLYIQPRQAVIVDELAHIISQSKGRNGALVASSIRQLMEVWGRCHGQLTPPAFSHTGRTAREVAEQQGRVVKNPALTFVSMATIQSFFGVIGSEGIENGFLNRFMLCVSEVQPTGVLRAMFAKKNDNKDVPAEIVQWVESVNAWHMSAFGELGAVENAGIEANSVVLDFSPEAAELFAQFEEGETLQRRKELAVDGMGEMFNRRAEMALRVALIVSISLNERQVSEQAARWAINYVRVMSERAVDAIRAHIHDSEFQAVAKDVYRHLERAGVEGMTRREINKTSRRFRALDLQGQGKVLEWLGALMNVVVTERTGWNNKKTPVYVAARDEDDGPQGGQ